jgi:hypothetical protein
MFTGDAIGAVVEVLEARRAHFYHACQYKDFNSYLEIGGIPSRSLLEGSGIQFTAFDTDQIDQTNAVWDKVFLNLADFGATFGRGQGAVPNPYGPILLRVEPRSLYEATDVAICLRSAGAQGFNREQESLRFPEDVERLFAKPRSDEYPASTFIKFARELQQEFDSPNARDPEISLTAEEGYIGFEYVDRVIVDPYEIGGTRLRQSVEQLLRRNGVAAPVFERRSSVGAERYNELASLVAERTPPLQRAQDWDVSDELKAWAATILARDLGYQFNRYANYLRAGTLNPLS